MKFNRAYIRPYKIEGNGTSLIGLKELEPEYICLKEEDGYIYGSWVINKPITGYAYDMTWDFVKV